MTAPSVPPEASNYLLFSDVHLGADLVQHMRPWTAERLREAHRIDRELSTMLDHYREHSDPLRPWRLVIAGDFIDLVGMSISGAEHAGLNKDEEVHGLGSCEDHVAVKMRAVAARHDLVFRKLAQFVAVGHSLVFVRGNHDVEFYWPAAQRAFVDALLERTEAAATEITREQFEARIEFRDWFYYVRGLLYVEHGHQYDATCAYHHVLAPRSPRDPRRISYSFSDILLRYVVRPTRELAPEGHENNSLFDYLRLAFSLGVNGCARLGYRFFGAVGRMVRVWRDHLSEHSGQVRAEHEQRLVQLSTLFRVNTENLRQMTQLWATPVTSRLFSIFRSVFLDGLALGLVAALAIAVLTLSGVISAWPWLPALLIGVSAVMFVYVKSSKVLDPHTALRLGASKLSLLLPARYVVMGHTHRPEMHSLNAASTYFNLGNWTSDVMEDPPPRAPCTHLVIRHDAGGQPEATLCRWQVSEGACVLQSDQTLVPAPLPSATAALRGGVITPPTALPPGIS
jgi:UDP-2,3-diacylglucosamine pyrophosphatase LpxH